MGLNIFYVLLMGCVWKRIFLFFVRVNLKVVEHVFGVCERCCNLQQSLWSIKQHNFEFPNIEICEPYYNFKNFTYFANNCT